MDRGDRFGILGFGDPAAEPYVEVIPPEDFEKSWQLLLPDGRRLQTGAAAVELAQMLPSARGFATLVTRLRLRWLIEVAYAVVARNRAWLGKMVRDAPGPKRLP